MLRMMWSREHVKQVELIKKLFNEPEEVIRKELIEVFLTNESKTKSLDCVLQSLQKLLNAEELKLEKKEKTWTEVGNFVWNDHSRKKDPLKNPPDSFINKKFRHDAIESLANSDNESTCSSVDEPKEIGEKFIKYKHQFKLIKNISFEILAVAANLDRKEKEREENQRFCGF